MNNNEHTKEICQIESLKYKTRTEFKEKARKYYNVSLNNKWLDEFYPINKSKIDILIIDKCIRKDYTLISINKPRLFLKCNKCNHEWNPLITNFIYQDTCCPKCSGLLKYTQEEVELIIKHKCEEKNYTLLEPFVYENLKTKFHLKCNKDNNDWFVSYNNFINHDTGCSTCGKKSISKKLKKSIIDVEKNVNDRCLKENYVLLSPFIYINNTSKLELKCNKCGYDKWKPTYNKFINRKDNCPKCSGHLKLTQEEVELNVKKKCEEKNYTLLKPIVYTNQTTRIYLKCNKDGHIWDSAYNNFINGDYGCNKCSGKLQHTQQEAEDVIKKVCEENNYIYYPFIYKNVDTNIPLMCNKDGHKWNPTYDNFINQEKRCPKCNNSKGELKIEEYLKNKNIKFTQEQTFENCKLINNLKFDFYLPEQNICIEFDGEQHYRSVERFGGDIGLEKIKQRDNIKNEYCQNNNIKLIRIPYSDIKRIEEILNTELN